MRAVILALFFALTALPLWAKPLALVIGNDRYLNIEPLQKARADADGYAALLENLGFAVTLAQDQDARAMVETLAGFYDRIEPGDTVVFVYSGHGWSDGQLNYLLPTDIRASGSPTLLAAESMALRNGVSGILDMIAARAPGLTVAIVDACRNNPFPGEALTRSAGATRGLVRMQPPSGTFIAFSAGEGQTALDRLSDDDPSPYSVFTRVFLAELARPQDLQTAFKTTQQQVNAIARTIGHPQRPAYYDEVVGMACLAPDCRIEADADDAPRGPAAPKDPAEVKTSPELIAGRGEGKAEDPAAAEWRALAGSDSAGALEDFARRHEGTVYAILARARIAELARIAAADSTLEAARETPGGEAPVAETPGAETPGEDPPRADSPAPESPGAVTPGADGPGTDGPETDRPRADGPAETPPGAEVAGGAGANAGPDPADPGRPQLVPAAGPAGGGAGIARPGPAAAARPQWCATAFLPTEAAICGNPGLLTLDLTLEVLVLGRHGALDPEARAALLQSQRVWSRERNGCADALPCIDAFYRARIEALSRPIWRAVEGRPGRL